jgi:SAM-dependent methyltransferase
MLRMTPSPDSSFCPEQDAYILGTAAKELARLELQDGLWSAITESLWDTAGFASGQNLMELGCGPGFSSMALAQRVGANGSVFGLDRSAQFLDFLSSRAAEQGFAQINTQQGDITAQLDPSLHNNFDGIFARWLLCWMDKPEEAIQLAHQALRPGGKLVIFDYFHYHSLELLPQDPAFRFGIHAVEAAWRASGGNPSLGTTLPALVEEHGFRVTHHELNTRAATPQDPLWQWPTSFFPDFMPQLVADGFLTAQQAEDFLAAWDKSAKHQQGLFLAPPMLELVAEKI